MAIASPQVSREIPRSPVIGSVNRPKELRMPFVTAAMMQPAITSTINGVAMEREVGLAAMVMRGLSAARLAYTGTVVRIQWRFVMNPIKRNDPGLT